MAGAGDGATWWGRAWARLWRLGVGRDERAALGRLARALAGTRLEGPARRVRRLGGLARAAARARDDAEGLVTSLRRTRDELAGPGGGGDSIGATLGVALEQAERDRSEAQRALDLVEALRLAAHHGRLEEASLGLRPVQAEVRRALLGAAFDRACAEVGPGLEDDAAWLLVPGGTYPVGRAAGQGADDEGPVARVTLAPFWIARRALDPVTVAAVLRAGEGPQRARDVGAPEPREADRARRGTTWSEAVCVATRLGAELPSEVEWEVAQAVHGDALWSAPPSGGTQPGAGARRAREWCRDPFDPALYARLAAGLGPQAFGPWALRAARGGPLGPWRPTRRAGLDPAARHPDTQVRLVRRVHPASRLAPPPAEEEAS